MKKIILMLTAIAGIFIISCNSNSSQHNFVSAKETVTINEAVEILKGNALLIDVREPEEVAEVAYDVKEVVNIPLDSIESKLNNIPKDKQVIVACRSGKRSAKAYELLKAKGFTNIANMEGGMNAWSEASLPTKTEVTEKKSCCADPSSPNCNPDGTCKSPDEMAAVAGSDLSKNHLEIYAFHGTRQCETCKNMKANTKATLDKYFSEELKSGKIVFQIIDVDDAKNEKLAEKFQATGTALMFDNIENGKDNIIDWSDFAFDKANDAQAFIPELKKKINSELGIKN
jgi:rhodanese-related sulfurtransferase